MTITLYKSGCRWRWSTILEIASKLFESIKALKLRFFASPGITSSQLLVQLLKNDVPEVSCPIFIQPYVIVGIYFLGVGRLRASISE